MPDFISTITWEDDCSILSLTNGAILEILTRYAVRLKIRRQKKEELTVKRKEIRIEARARNNVLWHAVYDHGESLLSFCKRHNVSYQMTVHLLNLRVPVVKQDGTYRALCLKLSAIIGIPVDDLFPQWLYQLPKVKTVREFAFAELPAADQARLALPPPKDPFDEIFQKELAVSIGKALAGLHPVEQEVLSLTLAEELPNAVIGERLGRSGESVRRIKSLAMSKLRQKMAEQQDEDKEKLERHRVLAIIAIRTQRTVAELQDGLPTHRVFSRNDERFSMAINLGAQYRSTIVFLDKIMMSPLLPNPRVKIRRIRL